MLATLLFAMFAWLSAQTMSVANQFASTSAQYQAINQQQSMIAMSEGIELYYQERHVFPASLNTLVTTPGYEYLASSELLNQTLVTSPAITDSQWIFNRLALFMYDNTSGSDPSTYLTANSCGAGAFAVATSWCGQRVDGKNMSLWFRRETRDDYSILITTQRNNLVRLSQKFFSYYNANNAFPSVDQNSTNLTSGSNTALKTLANYAGTNGNCTGNYQYQGIPIDCSDMYDLWGGQIGYQFFDNGHVILTSETPIFNSAGNRIVVAVDL